MRPNVTLTDTADRPFNIASDTGSRVTLVDFGYMHCPDRCPLNMCTAVSAIGAMPTGTGAR